MFQPQTAFGLKLLAHELAHTLQRSDGPTRVIRADFQSDFAGRQDVPVQGTTVQPPGTVQVRAADGTWVYAPFGIYRPADVPRDLQGHIMQSRMAGPWRNPELWRTDRLQVLAIEMERKENAGELTVGDMTSLAGGEGSNMNVRVMMARVGDDYRFIGYDMTALSRGTPPVAYQGYVESEAGETRGVGTALFADRVVRSLSNGVGEMHLEVGTSEATARFHVEIWRIIGHPGRPSQSDKYVVSTRQMLRLALTWSGALTAEQRLAMVELAAREAEPTPAEAQAALALGGGAGSGSPAALGGFAPETLEAIRGFGAEVNANVR
jgi:hypothetical protein